MDKRSHSKRNDTRSRKVDGMVFAYGLLIISMILSLFNCNPEIRKDSTIAPITSPVDTVRYDREVIVKLNVINNSTRDIDKHLLRNINTFNESLKGLIRLELLDSIYIQSIPFDMIDIIEWYNIRDPRLDPIYQHDMKWTLNIYIADSEYLFDMHTNDREDDVMKMGFTPVSKTPNAETYRWISPTLDRVYVTAEGLENDQTFIHEIGHYFGLSHPEDLTREELERIGITTWKQYSSNFMTSFNCTNEFTEEQKLWMRDNAIILRYYLID